MILDESATANRADSDDGPRSVPSVRRPNLSTHLVGRILDLIRHQNLQAGDRLPSVTALAERFAVAPPTLREALRRLQATGVIDIRHGSGSYVRHDRERLLLANPNRGALDVDSILHVLDARAVIEPELAAAAAERAVDADVADLERLLREAERSFFPNDGTINRAKDGFHRAIARASGNPILAQIDEVLLEVFAAAYVAIFPMSRTRSRELHDHAAILQAIGGRDATRARELMDQHLRDARADIERLRAEAGAHGAPGPTKRWEAMSAGE